MWASEKPKTYLVTSMLINPWHYNLNKNKYRNTKRKKERNSWNPTYYTTAIVPTQPVLKALKKCEDIENFFNTQYTHIIMRINERFQ